MRRAWDGDENGFTLIELLTVVMIIAVMIAIAVPTFVGSRRKSEDTQAKATLRNALTAEKAHYADRQYFVTDSGAELVALREMESSLDWGTPSPGRRGVDVVTPAVEGANSNVVVMRSDSGSGRIFCLADQANGSDVGTWFANAAAGGSCPGVAPTMPGWDADLVVGWSY